MSNSDSIWEVSDCWVSEINRTSFEESLIDYHPEHGTGHKKYPDSYWMKMLSRQNDLKYTIEVSTDGNTGKGWNDKTKILLDHIKLRFDNTKPNRLTSEPRIKLDDIHGLTSFGKWEYVTITVDFIQKLDHHEYTTTLIWEKDESETGESFSKITKTGYKWRDQN